MTGIETDEKGVNSHISGEDKHMRIKRLVRHEIGAHILKTMRNIEAR